MINSVAYGGVNGKENGEFSKKIISFSLINKTQQM